jgi:hypothetical protein
MIERRTSGLLLNFVVLCALAVPLQAWAQAQRPDNIRITVDTILATNTGKGMDSKLSGTIIGIRLKELFEYTTYRLVMHQVRQTICGRMVTFEMPGGRILHIGPNAVLDNMIAMELVLFEGTRPEMTTDLKLMNHALLVIGGPRYQQGMLIEMISTDAPDRTGPREAIPSVPAGPIPANSSGSPQH